MTGTRGRLPGQTRYDLAPASDRAPAELEASSESPRESAETGRLHQNCVRSVFWIEIILAVVAASLAVVTGLYPDWIERVLRIDPDLHSGSIERNMVIACAVSAVLCAVLARRNWLKWVAT